MKKLNLGIIVLTGLFFLSLLSCGKEKKTESTDSVIQEEVTSEKGERKIVFENEYAMVVKIKLAPGEFIAPPGGEGMVRVIYSLTDYSLDWDKGDGKMEIKSWKANDVHFHEPGKHFVKNIGETTAEWLVFVRKNEDLPDCGENTIENDVNSVSPEFAQSLFDNDDFRMTKVSLPSGQSIPNHSGINRIIYSLSDYDLNYESDTEGKVEKQFKTGDIHWHEACNHALENAGSTEARFLVVSYKTKG